MLRSQPLASVVSAFVVLITPAHVPAQQLPVAPGSGLVTGQVIDATSKQPVGGAVVALTVPPGDPAPSSAPPVAGMASPPAAIPRRAAAVTNADGRFVFRDVPAGTYALTATRNGYAPGATGRRRPGGPSRTFTLADGARINDAVVTMWRFATISGSVRDDRGEPVVGVYVRAMRRTMIGGRLELSFTGGGGEATDDRGQYRVTNLEPGSYLIMIRTSPQVAAVSTIEKYRAAAAAGTAAAMSRQLREGGALNMVMNGLVIDGWQVSSSSDPQILPGPNGTLLLSPMTFSGNVRSAAEATLLTLAAGEDRSGVDLTLPLVAGMRVSGTLIGPDGPAANHGVQLLAANADVPAYPYPLAYSITDAAGRFAILGVTPGSYVVRARRVSSTGPVFVPAAPTAGVAGGRETVLAATPSNAPALFAETPVTVGASHVDGVTLTLQPGPRVSGRVVFEGTAAPPTAAQVQRIAVTVRAVVTNDAPGYGGQTNVDATGAFQSAGYAPGRYLVSATSPTPEWVLASIRVGGVDASDQAVTLGATDVTDVVVTFTDKPIALAGTVRPTGPGTDADATVIAFPADTRAWLASGMSPRRFATAVTAASGAYQLRIGIPGDYLVIAIPPEIVPDLDPDLLTRLAASATRVSFAAGENKTLPLTVSRIR